MENNRTLLQYYSKPGNGNQKNSMKRGEWY